MNEAQALDFMRDAIWTLIIVVAPIMLVGLVVGLIISLFQALTSIQEMTLTFVPKILSGLYVIGHISAFYARDDASFYGGGRR